MSSRKPFKRWNSRPLVFEPLAARLVLSMGNPLSAAIGVDLHEAAAYALEHGRDYRPPEIAESRAPKPAGYEFERGGLRGDFGLPVVGPPVFATTSWIAPTVWIVIVVDVPAPLRASTMSQEAPPPHREAEGLMSPNMAPLVAAMGGVSSSQFSSPAGNASTSVAANALATPVWLAGTTQSQQVATSLAAVQGTPWLPNSPLDQIPRVDNSPSRNMLVPDDSRASEGGLIELENPRAARPKPDDEAIGDLRGRRKLDKELAALEWVWSELGNGLKSANEILAKAHAARQRVPAEQQLAAEEQRTTLAGEGGMIELAADSGIVAVVPHALPAPDRAPIDAMEMTMAAGVALFQAFELGTGPGGNERSASIEAGPTASDKIPQENAAADDAGQPLNRAAIFAGAALVPLAMRARRSSDEGKKTGRMSEILRRLGFHAVE
jgi:hypothetical protein